jgi:hypothetical protein
MPCPPALKQKIWPTCGLFNGDTILLFALISISDSEVDLEPRIDYVISDRRIT